MVDERTIADLRRYLELDTDQLFEEARQKDFMSPYAYAFGRLQAHWTGFVIEVQSLLRQLEEESA